MTTRSRQLEGRRREQGAVLALAGVILAAPAAVFAQCQYEVTIIQAPEEPWGQPGTSARAVNNHGAVVGWRCDYICDTTHWFLWTPESGFTLMPHPPEANSTYASDINDDGVVVGTAYGAGFSQRGFIYDHGEWTYLLPAPGGAWCSARAINSAGVVVGERSIGDGVNPLNAYVWSSDSGFTDLGVMDAWKSAALDVNDAGVVVGTRGLSEDEDAFIWCEGKLTLLGPIPGGISSNGRSINSDGEVAVAGWVELKGGDREARVFIWRDGAWIPTDTLPDYPSVVAWAINDRGQIVGQGTRRDPHTEMRAFIWVDGAIHNLNDLIPPGIGTFERAFDINNRGQIVGRGSVPDVPVDVGMLLTPVDSPNGDLDGDCDVDVSDLLFLLDDWGSQSLISDLNGDGIVNVFDLLILLANWS